MTPYKTKILCHFRSALKLREEQLMDFPSHFYQSKISFVGYIKQKKLHTYISQKNHRLTSQEVPCFLTEGSGGGKVLLTLAESATNSSCAEDITFGHQQRSYVFCFIFMSPFFFRHSTVTLQK